MYQGRTVFTQFLDFLPRHTFRRLVKRYRGDHRIRSFSCWDQFLAMAFAQLTYRESLRDIEACLGAIPDKLYHLGFRSAVSRRTLADANEKRDWRIYADFAQVLIAEARRLYATEPLEVDLDLETTVYALDSTTIDLCLDLFPWARFQEESGAIKMHTLLDLPGPISALLWITDGRVHDVNILDVLAPESGSIYIFDRGYIDFWRLYRLHQARAIFVTRAKKNVPLRRHKSHPVDRTTGLFCDQTAVLTTRASRANYPTKLLQGSRDRESVHVPDQRLHAAGAHDREALQVPLTDRTLLQVDQAASPDQELLRHVAERGQDPDLDRHLRLRAGRHRPETARHRARPVHFATDPEHYPLREIAATASTCETGLLYRKRPKA